MKKLTCGLAAATIMMAGAAMAEKNLSVVGSWSSLDLHKSYENPFWSEALSAATGGALTATVTTHDQLGVPGGDVYKLLDDGLFDVSMTVMDYAVQDAPEMESLDLPMLSQDVATARAVAEAFQSLGDQVMQARFNSKLLAIVPYPQQVVFCSKPVSGLADLEGLKIRASGRSTLNFLEAAGAEALNIAFNEVPGALDQGIIDCAVTGSLSGYSAAWYELATHLFTLPAGGWDYVVTAMSLDTWNGLSSSEQADLEKAVKTQFSDLVWENAISDTEQGVACLTGQGTCTKGTAADMVLVAPSAADIARSREILEQDVLPAWANRVDATVVQLWNQSVGSVVGLTAKK